MAHRLRTPTVLQMEATECGAASLGIVLGCFGRIVPLEELRVACGVSRDGSSARNVVKAARAYGLEPHAFRVEPERLRSMPLPQILWWGLEHFVVVEGFHRDEVFLNDPGTGPRRVSWEELERRFTGVVITFKKGPDFEPGGQREPLRRRLATRLTTSSRALAFILVAGLALVVPGLVLPALTRVFVDDYLVDRSAGVAVPLVAALAGTAMLIAGLTWLQQRALRRLQIKLTLRMGAEFVWHVLRLPVRFFAERHAGDVAWRVSLNDQISDVLSGQLATNAVGLITAVFYLAAMAYFDLVLASVAVLCALASLGVLRLVARKRKDLNQRVLREQAQVQGASVAGLRGIETIKASGTEAGFFARWAGKYAALTDVSQGLAVPTQGLNALPTFISGLTTAAVLCIGGLRVMDGDITAGTLVAFQLLLVQFLVPISAFVALGGQLQEIEANLTRLDDVLRHEVDSTFAEPPPPDPDARGLPGSLELRGLRFGYNPLDAPLIDGFELALAPGQRVAIVGPSGSGKSTLARLVAGLYRPWSGQILLDGRPREDIPRAVLAESLAMVDQEIALFEGTVRDNLTLWDHTISERDVAAACRDARVHGDIVARRGGYASRVDEGGRNFSGGQRQRLEIARALVRNPSLLVLDEATSALDPVVELEIDRNLRRRGCTTLVVAHRLSTIRDADEIIVLDGGKVVQRGRHETLLGQPGLYAELIGAEDG